MLQCDVENRRVEQNEIEQVYKDKNFIGWTEISVKQNLMVSDSVR